MQVMNFSSTNCKNCYKCVRTCAVKAIEVKEDQAHIITERCIACGHCLVVCPQNARDVKSSLENVKKVLESNQEIVVSLAPSYRAYFEESGKFISALKKLGFSRIEETAIGAEQVSKAYETYLETTHKTECITSCCPSAVRLIQRYYSDLIDLLIPIVSPMIAHGRMIKEQSKGAYTVFIGPCISKICEALSEEVEGAIDAVITFDEVIYWMNEQGIDYRSCSSEWPNAVGTLRGSQYPIVGGVLKSIKGTLEKKHLQVLQVQGMDHCRQVLNDLREGKLKHVCVEMNICNESCMAGPGGHNQEGSVFTRINAMRKSIEVLQDDYREGMTNHPQIPFERTFKNNQVEIYTATEAQIKQVFETMGKYEKSDELNCGACGYETCRDKAIAVLHGMSQVDMCLPYTRSIAERLSNEIFYNSPNSILLLDRNCKILDMNPSAQVCFGYESILMKGKDIQIIMDRQPFERVLRNKMSSNKEKITLPTYDLVVYRDIIYLEKQQALLVIFADVTDEEKRKQEVSRLKGNTLDVTQSIIDKQMRVAQEIASLLGETTAETKVALMKLKKVLSEEGDR